MPVENSNGKNLPKPDPEKMIESAGHSEVLIRDLVAAGNHNDQIHETIKRNTEHLKIVLSRDIIINYTSPRLADFEEAIALGEEFISNI